MVVAVALIGASVALVQLTRQTLVRNVRTAAELRAHEVAVMLVDGTTPSSLRIANEEDVVVQVTDDEGGVLASTRWFAGRSVMARGLAPGQSRIVQGFPGEDEDAFVVVAESARTSEGTYLVLVGRNLDSVEESAAVVANILLAVVPILVVVVGITTWLVVGRALAPMEAIRKEVAEISAAELHRRVPIPEGQDEVALLATTMNGMLARLADAHDRQQRLVSDASHELRSPIAAIRQQAEVAMAYPAQTTIEDLATEVLQEDLRLERLAEDLLLLARADEHALRLSARDVDVDDLVLAEARRLGQATHCRIDTTGISAARTRGDRQLLQRVIRNLAENAAGHAGSVITLGVREDNGHVVVDVDDDGPGVPEAKRAAVFERFTRLDESRARRDGGAGLGLAIVAEIVAAHGGSVTVSDAPSGGARFSVALPKDP